MGSLRRQVKCSALPLAIVIMIVGEGACSSDDAAVDDETRSPCEAFSPAPDPPHYELEHFAHVASLSGSPIFALTSSQTKVYALVVGAIVTVSQDGASSVAMRLDPADPNPASLAVSNDGLRLYALSRSGFSLELDRFTSTDGGLTFDPTTRAVIVPPMNTREAGGAIAIDAEDILWIATPDAPEPQSPSAAQDDTSHVGKVLRVTGEKDVEVFARGFHSPTSIAIDPDQRDVWVADVGTGPAAEINRVLKGKSYGWPILDGNRCFTPAKDCIRDGHVAPVAIAEGRANNLLVHRGSIAPLVGNVVFTGGTQDVEVLKPFGPSGLSQTAKLGLPAPYELAAKAPTGELLITSNADIWRIKNIAPRAPLKLLATGCFDPASPTGAPRGAIAYDVASPLWSDGAQKLRHVVIPQGQRAHAVADGDIRFPVGTVAVKTFIVDGKKVETRLLIEHALESWVGYSYAWNDEGTDATLVTGNRSKALANGKSWYFPSSDDCTACHTPAAGYVLGIEARQIAGDSPASAALDKKLIAPIDHARFPLLASPSSANATLEARARGYLHSNCSICHRDGSVAGVAELDLRVDVPLDRTGLCTPPKTSAFGIADARIVAPKDPARSTLLYRLKALDEARMPKLASHVVDDAAVSVIQEWIASLASCP